RTTGVGQRAGPPILHRGGTDPAPPSTASWVVGRLHGGLQPTRDGNTLRRHRHGNIFPCPTGRHPVLGPDERDRPGGDPARVAGQRVPHDGDGPHTAYRAANPAQAAAENPRTAGGRSPQRWALVRPPSGA